MWDDIQEWWANLDEEKKGVLADAIIGQAGVEGNQALRETIPSTEEIAASRIPGPTPLEEKAAYMEGRGSYTPTVTAIDAPIEEEEEKEPDLLNKLFLMSLMENMQGGDIGQAPAVVAGGGRREFPTMARQFAPWEREKPYWWIR